LTFIKRFKVFLVPENKVSITVTYKPYDDVTRPIFCGGSWWWSLDIIRINKPYVS
jgi:hypothetical protein